MGRGKKRTRQSRPATNPDPLAALPTLGLDRVYHIGTLNSADKRSFSDEGAGVSVSLTPAAWDQIAKLPAAPWWQMARHGARFLDRHSLDEPATRAIATWGVGQGLVEMRRGIRIEYDHEFEFSGVERCVCYCASPAEARETIEAEELENATIASGQWLAPLAPLEQRCGVAIDDGDCFDYLVPVWVEDCTDLDGVWWADVYDPETLSVPRGVIVPSRLERFARVQLGANARAELGSPY